MSRHSTVRRLFPLVLLGGIATLYVRRKTAAGEVVGAFGLSKALDTATANAQAESDRQAAQRAAIAKVKKTVANNLRLALGPKKKRPPPSPPLYVFVHERDKIMPARKAAQRIEAASGIKIHVNEPGTFNTAQPVFGSDFLCANGLDGRAYPGFGLAISRTFCKYDPEVVLVHEFLHLLGAGHLVLPARGILNAAKDGPLLQITADDLALLCAARNDCTRFQPEV